jgi:hypothetical protein
MAPRQAREARLRHRWSEATSAQWLLLIACAACLVPAAHARASHLLPTGTKTFCMKGMSMEMHKPALGAGLMQFLQQPSWPSLPQLHEGKAAIKSFCCPGYYDSHLGIGLPFFCVPCGHGFYCNGACSGACAAVHVW